MNQLPAGSFEISDEQLVEARARVRALHLQRYEQIWNRIAWRIEADEAMQRDPDGAYRPLDPRFLELAIRVLQQEAVLYQLAKPQPVLEQEEDPVVVGVDRKQLVLQSLSDLAAKRAQQAA
jgi:hypothetical protein